MLTLGRITIDRVAWSAPMELTVEFSSGNDGRRHQCYLGRKMMGETSHEAERSITFPYRGSRYPEHLWIVAIDAEDIGQDRGSSLPSRPYNVIRVSFDNESWTGEEYELDCKVFELFLSSEPDGEIDYNTVAGKVLYDGTKTYTIESQPIGPSGTYGVAVRGRDTRLVNGNAGTAVEGSFSIISYPPDFDDDFAVTVGESKITVSVTIPED